LSCLVLSCLVLSCLVLSCLNLSRLVLSCLVLSSLFLSCLSSSCLALSCVSLVLYYLALHFLDFFSFCWLFYIVYVSQRGTNRFKKYWDWGISLLSFVRALFSVVSCLVIFAHLPVLVVAWLSCPVISCSCLVRFTFFCPVYLLLRFTFFCLFEWTVLPYLLLCCVVFSSLVYSLV
jgi:hypothetical protein